ncbi:MAG: class I SAM-dependent methyltransferase [Xenococcaceae cyanobacterium]
MKQLIQEFKHRMSTGLVSLLPQRVLRDLVARLWETNPQEVLEVIGPYLNRKPNLDNMPFDLPVEDILQFEHLSGLFASNSLNHGVISMTIRQTAYMFGIIRQLQAHKVIEIGRYKGGSTLVIAAALSEYGGGELWSIDIGKKEARSQKDKKVRSYNEQIADALQRLNLKSKVKANILVGDSRTLEIDTGEVDVVFIDGDHSYEGVKNDFERFGKRVRVGGAVLFDDVFDEGIFKTHSDTVGRLVNEIVADGEFKLVKNVNRLGHLERVIQQ